MSQINNSSTQLQNPSRLRFDEEVRVGIHVVCQHVGMINSRGLWFHDDPLEYTLPLLLLQLSLISIITRSIYIFLKPLGQPSIVSHILGGVILGPSILGHNLAFMNKIFPREGRITLETLSVFGIMLFIFQVGVKIDPSIVWKSGKRALVVGILGFFIPFALASSIRLLLCHSISLDDTVCHVLQLVVLMQSVTAFPVIAIFLAEFKILNSDIGRLASSSSMICDMCFWSFMSVFYVAHVAKEKSMQSAFGSILSVGFLVYLLLFGIRPAALWAIRNTPEGKPVKDAYIYVIFVALMGFGFLGEVIGINSLITSFLLGVVIPDGPPLGAAIVDRLDCFVSALLMPIFFTLCGLKTNVFSVQKWKTVGVILLVVFIGFLGKIIGTMLPPLFCRMPFRDALALGLLMNSKGIVELVLLNDWKTNSDSMTDECFAIMILSVVVLIGAISPLVRALYDPSRRFLAYRRRTIRHHHSNEELRILACILSQDNVRTIINLLDVSNHTSENPIGIYVLHLIKLAGRASSLLITHLPREKPSQNPTESERIFNAFKKFEHENCSHAALHCCKSISPYETMHNDVCSVALEHRISFIIIPFYKQSINGKMVNSFHVFRHLNKNVLDKAPCSVGVLVDRGNFRKSFAELLSCRIVVLFFGGADDREALAYAVRMSGNPHVSVTLLHFTTTSISEGAEIAGGTERSKRLDSEILDEYKLNAEENERVSYLEEVVMDSEGVLAVIESIENSYDLVMVGKRHGESELMSNLGKCNEHIELGAIGEMLAVTDSELRASVLVVQQQTRVWGLRDAEDSSLLRREEKDVAGVPNSNVYRI
ncbi:PREDICTED: cation/H(+) antiporter 15-like [Populus euphratica]|uniref:Cation/H(+) antiporter 15-like n=1 Tax=Populus euphratica TaxID=75702 RepID=A0AAJ6V669_POPEU|nr:PREDICTED: cation/H(+) antiporter 15-like [Populus euphratica]